MALTGNPFLPENDRGTGLGNLGGRLMFSVCTGAASASDITLTGLNVEDTITFVMRVASGVPSDVTANVTSIANNAFRLSSVTSGDVLMVCWLSRALPWA